MKNLLLNILVSCVVATATVTILYDFDTTSIVDIHNEQPNSSPNANKDLEKLKNSVAELSQTQSIIQEHLNNLDLYIQTIESSVHDSSASLWDEIASIEQVRVIQTDLAADSNAAQIAQSQGENAEFSSNFEQESQEQNPEEHIAKMDAVFYTQEADQTWDDAAREQIHTNYMSAQPSGLLLQDLSCAGIMCRMEILQEPGVEMTEHSFNEQPLVPWDHRARTASIQNPDGSTTTVMYISRQGYKLPSL